MNGSLIGSSPQAVMMTAFSGVSSVLVFTWKFQLFNYGYIDWIYKIACMYAIGIYKDNSI